MLSGFNEVSIANWTIVGNWGILVGTVVWNCLEGTDPQAVLLGRILQDSSQSFMLNPLLIVRVFIVSTIIVTSSCHMAYHAP